MLRYKVITPFVDYGIYHEADSIITDVSLIQNMDVKLWNNTIVAINEDGKELKEEIKANKVEENIKPEKPTPVQIPKQNQVNSKVVKTSKSVK